MVRSTVEVGLKILIKLSEAFALLALAACSISTSSCLLLFQGTTEEVTVISDPPGATVILNNGETRVTPFTMEVKRNQDLQLHISKPGYQPVNLSDNSQVEPLIVVDAIPLMLPWAIDASQGAGYAHQQTTIVAHLEPVPGSEQSLQPQAAKAAPADVMKKGEASK